MDAGAVGTLCCMWFHCKVGLHCQWPKCREAWLPQSFVCATGAAHLELKELPAMYYALKSHEQRLYAPPQTYFAPSIACVPPNLLANLPLTSTAWVVDISKPSLRASVAPILALSLQHQYMISDVTWHVIPEHQLYTGKHTQ